MKARKKGKPKMPCVGYRTPVKIRGLVKGLKPKLVYNPKAVNDVDKTTEGIIIGRTVGQRKRAEIIKVADQLNIKVLNR
jgi:large subunit ribosomal protein L32e